MTTTIIFVSAVCFSLFVWGVSSHFRREGPMPRMMRVTSAASLFALGWFVADRWRFVSAGGSTEAVLDVAAMAMMAASVALFCWAVAVNRARPLSVAFSGDTPQFVQQDGPYAYMRHPFYLSYLIFWVATAVAARRAVHWLAPAGMLILYYSAARLEEAKFAASPLAGNYALYRSRTGMLLPARLVWRRFAR